MVVIYPKNAITMKDVDSLNYLTYASMSVNLNQYNNECSNTYMLLNIAAREIYRSIFDIQYQPTFSLENVDFTTIDRINRFNLEHIDKLTLNTNTNSISASDYIIGYSVLTNNAYKLENVNSFTDFTRHSIPCDAFAEIYNKIESLSPVKLTLQPYKKININQFKVCDSRISIELVDYNILNILTDTPKVKVSGIDIFDMPAEEIIEITNGYSVESIFEYKSINSVMVMGVTTSISILLNPYIIKRYGKINFKYVDKEDPLTEYEAVYSFDKNDKSLKVSLLNNANMYPARFDYVESIQLNIPEEFSVDEYTFDDANGLLYTICVDELSNKLFLAFPISIPFSFENIGELYNTEKQSLKITYNRDTINRFYQFEVWPTSNSYGFDSLDISIKHSYSRKMGLWSSNRSYLVGDLVIFSGIEYICTVGHISSLSFDLNKFTDASKKVVSNFLIELISSSIESNRFEISFDDLFLNDTESIVEFTTSGNEICIQQILCQYHKLDPCIIKDLKWLLSTFVVDKLSPLDDTILYPIENEENKLIMSKIERYRYSLPVKLDYSEKFYIYKVSTSGKININGYPIVNIYNTFFIDQQTNTLVTSDTITNIFNQDEKDIGVYEKFIVSTYGESGAPIIISDSFNRLFVNKKGSTYAN